MESNDLRALSELYLKTVYEAKAESPEEEEEKDKEDDDLAGSPNKNGKKNGKKSKRWWDDDGDGKGYEKGEVDGKFPDKDGSKKKKDVKEGVASKKKPSVHDDYYDPMEDPEFDPHEAEATRGQSGRGTSGKMNVRKKYPVKEAVYGGKKEAPKDNRMVLTHADKKANTPAWQNRDKKNPKTGESIYKKADHLNKEEVEVDEGYEDKKKGEVLSAMKRQGRKLSDKDKDKIANKVVASKGDTSKSDDRYAYEELDPGMEHNLSILRMLAEKEVNVKDTKKVVDAIRAYDKSKDASRDATDDSDKGDKEGAAIEKKYAAKERGEIKKDDPNWKNKKYHTGMHGEEVESLVASGKFSNEELMSIANLQEADIADILARLEKKRISKGGDPDESPLPAMKKYHADKKKKKVKEEVESIEEADSLSAQVSRWEAARQKRMKQRQSYERPSWIPRDQDHEDNWGSSKGEKKKG